MPITKAKSNVIDLDKNTSINGVIIGRGVDNSPENFKIGDGVTMSGNQLGFYNLAIGNSCLAQNNAGSNNICVGHQVMAFATAGSDNTCVGYGAGSFQSIGSENTNIGKEAGGQITTANSNTYCGAIAGYTNQTGMSNTAVGSYSLVSGSGNIYNTINCTAIGAGAMEHLTALNNSSALGASAQVTGNNQVQLGSSGTTTYAYGAVQNRSDIRDKTDIRDTELGLDFIKALRPVDFKWDMREDYRLEKPKKPKEDASEEEKNAYEIAIAEYASKWKLSDITHDGSKKRNRFHHGLIAQEVKALLDSKGIDFGGFQDHKIAGGDDVLSIGYIELIAPMIKAIQELSAEVASLKAQLNP